MHVRLTLVNGVNQSLRLCDLLAEIDETDFCRLSELGWLLLLAGYVRLVLIDIVLVFLKLRPLLEVDSISQLLD